MDDDEIICYQFTDKGLRIIIAAYEYSLGYEPIETGRMKRKQLLTYFVAMRSKADLHNFPDRKYLWGEYVEQVWAFEQTALYN